MTLWISVLELVVVSGVLFVGQAFGGAWAQQRVDQLLAQRRPEARPSSDPSLANSTPASSSPANSSPPNARAADSMSGGSSNSSGAQRRIFRSDRPRGGDDGQHWIEQAQNVHGHVLDRTRHMAERWSNLFIVVLGLFGVAVFVGQPDGGPDTPPGSGAFAVAASTTVAFGLNAVLYSRLAAAAPPRLLVDVSARAVLYQVREHSARALVRLRLALVAGAVAAVAAVAALVSLWAG